VVKRLTHEPVTVWVDAHDRPCGFRWRGRGYLIREILTSWQEGPIWWRECDAGAGWSGVGPFGADLGAADMVSGADHRFWRVVARLQQRSTTPAGVYDLVEMQRCWWLSRLWD